MMIVILVKDLSYLHPDQRSVSTYFINSLQTRRASVSTANGLVKSAFPASDDCCILQRFQRIQ